MFCQGCHVQGLGFRVRFRVQGWVDTTVKHYIMSDFAFAASPFLLLLILDESGRHIMCTVYLALGAFDLAAGPHTRHYYGCMPKTTHTWFHLVVYWNSLRCGTYGAFLLCHILKCNVYVVNGFLMPSWVIVTIRSYHIGLGDPFTYLFRLLCHGLLPVTCMLLLHWRTSCT